MTEKTKKAHLDEYKDNIKKPKVKKIMKEKKNNKREKKEILGSSIFLTLACHF